MAFFVSSTRTSRVMFIRSVLAKVVAMSSMEVSYGIGLFRRV